MKPAIMCLHVPAVRVSFAAALLMACQIVHGQENLEAIRKSAIEMVEAADTDVLFRKLELAKKYIAALEGLEKRYAAQGDLDAIVRVREEKEMVEKSGATTAHEDKPLIELREKYVTARDAIDKDLDAARAKTAAGIATKIREEEAALVKAGKVDEALALRQAGDRMIIEIAGAGAAGDVTYHEDPRATASVDLQPLEEIEVPSEQPPVVEKAFAQPNPWMESLTTPVGRQRLRGNIIIGNRGEKNWPNVPLVVVPPGSSWSGENQYILLSAANLVATKSRFSNLRMEPDYGSRFYFVNCAFDDCAFRKGGVWFGGDQAGKFYMEGCLFRKRFGTSINVVDHGFRIENSVFEGMDLPPVNFRTKQPADYVNHPWLRIVNCRFVRCEIPASFLLLTRDCVFDNCTFVDSVRHRDEADIIKPIEVVLYVKGSRSRITDLPEKVTLTEKPESDLKGVAVPTSASLTAIIDR